MRRGPVLHGGAVAWTFRWGNQGVWGPATQGDQQDRGGAQAWAALKFTFFPCSHHLAPT